MLFPNLEIWRTEPVNGYALSSPIRTNENPEIVSFLLLWVHCPGLQQSKLEKKKIAFLFSSLCSYGPNSVVLSEPALTPSGRRELSLSRSNLSGSHVAPMCLSRKWSLHHHKHRFLLIEDHKQMTLDSLISGSTLLKSRNRAIKTWQLRLLFC